MTRRDVLRASAGAAAAVPVAALGVNAASAAPQTEHEALAILDRADEPVMFFIHDVKRGEVSILRGTNEVVITDRRLVGRLLRAADEPRPLSTSYRRWVW